MGKLKDGEVLVSLRLVVKTNEKTVVHSFPLQGEPLRYDGVKQANEIYQSLIDTIADWLYGDLVKGEKLEAVKA